MAKQSKYNQRRIALALRSPIHLVGTYSMSEAIHAEVQPESWQAKGKRRKPRVK